MTMARNSMFGPVVEYQMTSQGLKVSDHKSTDDAWFALQTVGSHLACRAFRDETLREYLSRLEEVVAVTTEARVNGASTNALRAELAAWRDFLDRRSAAFSASVSKRRRRRT
jgi:hypothetical protein